jgi:hypothetical protein
VKRWLIISGAVLACFATIVLLTLTFGAEYIAEHIVLPRVQQRLGGDMSWGRVSASFGEIVLENISLQLPDVPEIDLTVDRLAVSYHVLALLEGRLDVSQVAFHHPRVEVHSIEREVIRRFGEQISSLARRGERSLAESNAEADAGSPGTTITVLLGEILLDLPEQVSVHFDQIDATLEPQGRFDCRIGTASVRGASSSDALVGAGPILILGQREQGTRISIQDTTVENLSLQWRFGDGSDELQEIISRLRQELRQQGPDEPFLPDAGDYQADSGVDQHDSRRDDSLSEGNREAGGGLDATATGDAEDNAQLSDTGPSDAGLSDTGTSAPISDIFGHIQLPSTIHVSGCEFHVVWDRSSESRWEIGLVEVGGEIFLGDEDEPPFVRLSGNTRPGEGRFSLSGILDSQRPRLDLQLSSLRIAQIIGGLPLERVRFDDGAVLEGDLSIGLVDDDFISFELEASTNGFTVEGDLLANAPLEGLRLRAVTRGRIHVASRRLDIEESLLQLNGIGSSLTGYAARTDEYTDVNLTLELFSTSCADLLASTPRPLRDRLDELNLEGVIGGRLRIVLDTRRLDETILDVNIQNGCRATGRGRLSIERLSAPFWHRVELPGEEVHEFRSGPGSGNWASLDEISPFMASAVLTTEDGGFFYHSGFSLREIRNALIRDVRAGGPRFGASTISMQLARNLYLYRGRTLARKLQEAVMTWYLEANLRKEEILTIYLNIIEFGPRIFGISQAAMHYFGRQPDDLSPREAVFLSRLLPAPVPRYEETYAEGELSNRWEARLDRVLRLMHERHRLTADELRDALAERIVFHREGDPLPPPRTWRRASGIQRGQPDDLEPDYPIRPGEEGDAYIPAPPDLMDEFDD